MIFTISGINMGAETVIYQTVSYLLVSRAKRFSESGKSTPDAKVTTTLPARASNIIRC